MNSILYFQRMKAMENELKDKTKVDRGLLNSWFSEVQRTKVNYRNSQITFVILFFYQDEAEKYRKRRDSTIDQDKQIRLAVQEIEQVKNIILKIKE